MALRPPHGLPGSAIPASLALIFCWAPSVALASEGPAEVRPGSSGLLWLPDEDPVPLLGQEQDQEQHVPAPLAVPPPPVTAPRPAAPVASGLRWVAEDDSPEAIALPPEPSAAPAAVASRAPAARASGLAWTLDEEFTSLVAANPEEEPHQILAAAAANPIATETVVEQLAAEVPADVLSHEALALLLLEPPDPPPAAPLEPPSITRIDRQMSWPAVRNPSTVAGMGVLLPLVWW